jgi:hypothetical protein
VLKLTRRAVFALTLAGVAALAAERPNFSGEWKLNSGKSDFGPMAGNAPTSMTRKIEHKGDDLSATTTQATPNGERTQTSKYKTDGSDSVNKAQTPMGEIEVKSVASWDGAKLVVKTSREIQGAQITQTETWTLSEDGKMLTVDNKISSPMGDFDIKLVMDKQP